MADHDEWHLIGQDDASEGALSRPTSPPLPPSSSLAAEQQPAGTAVPTAVSACCSSTEVASPASERLADCVLGQPFPPVSTDGAGTLPLSQPCPVAALSTYQSQAPEVSSSQAIHAAHNNRERSEELETVMSVQALSGEGSLEGFHDPAAPGGPQQGDGDVGLDDDDSAHVPPPRHHGLLSWLERGLGALSSLLACIPSKVAGLWRACAAELHEEVADLRRVFAHTRLHFSQEVTKSSSKVADVVSRRTPRATTLVPLLSLSTVVACCGLLHFMARCQRLNSAMQQRERELSRLLLKVLNLQEALQQPRRVTPILRHTGIMPGALAVSSCML
ncbi:hypothetical protein DUNSADRAFT_5367 [Dunaliella salina]|uniref:Uncharacterized protein n=1 Tax=Dunaliella salina TaxID=3046 RepID=A0ABQ7GQE4_DUNSA|nr:hypothetical protein DUNSADRAFT_5367 [Dunaliella salina]|eukprot:KAF5836827.1 hypothetical protein DUNSADRAFT_5367 [Dunaliella salina]